MFTPQDMSVIAQYTRYLTLVYIVSRCRLGSKASVLRLLVFRKPALTLAFKGYYDHFPQADMNVAVKMATVDIGDNQTMKKNVLIVTKDVMVGEVIYKVKVYPTSSLIIFLLSLQEDPVVAALDLDLQSTGSHCSHCLRKIDPDMSLRLSDDPLKAAYCSKACQTKASIESHNLLFGQDPPFPNLPSANPTSNLAKQNRREAQERLVASLSGGKITALLVARFIGRQVTAEITKLGTDKTGATPITASGGASAEGYSLYDHIERLRYLELSIQHEEVQLITQVLETAMSGLEQFVTDERYITLRGKMAYNAIGVCFGGGRSDKARSKVMTELIR